MSNNTGNENVLFLLKKQKNGDDDLKIDHIIQQKFKNLKKEKILETISGTKRIFYHKIKSNDLRKMSKSFLIIFDCFLKELKIQSRFIK